MPQVSPRAQKEAEWNIQTEGNAAVTYRLPAWPHQPGTHMPFDGQSSGPLVKRPTLELCVLQPFFCPSWGRLTELKVPEGKDHRYPLCQRWRLGGLEEPAVKLQEAARGPPTYACPLV